MTLRRFIVWLCSSVAVVLVVVTASGFLLFNMAASDPLRPVDAMVVLGGEHDGRELHGLQLAQQGLAPVLLLSNPYDDDPVMSQMCDRRIDKVEVICERPDPLTTGGEALFTHRLAAERNWHTFVIVTWRYHLPRARYVFSHCFADEPHTLIMRAVPRAYDYSLLDWESVYFYQFAGFVKAWAEPAC